MEADWNEITRIVIPNVTGIHNLAQQASPASAIVFDDQQELVWVGTDQVSFVTLRVVPNFV